MSLSAPDVVVDDNDLSSCEPVDWRGVIAAEELVLAAAVRAGDWTTQAYCHLALGLAAQELGDHRRARQQLAEGNYILAALA